MGTNETTIFAMQQRWQVISRSGGVVATRCARAWRWLLAQFALAVACVGWAFAAGATPSTTFIDWAQPSPTVPLTPHVRFFKETPGAPLSWSEAWHSTAWQPSQPPAMAALHGAATLWMQVGVENTGPAPVLRVVSLDYWALRDVQLFALDAQSGQLLSHQRSGQMLAPEDRALKSERPAFALTLAPGQRLVLLMRMDDKYWSHVKLDAWEGATFARAHIRSKLGFSAVTGAALALCVVLWLQRSKILAFVSVWVLFSLGVELTFAGLMTEFVVPTPVMTSMSLVLVVGAFSNAASGLVTMYFMGLERHPFWSWWTWALLAVAVLMSGLMLDDHSYLERQGLMLVNFLQILSSLVMLFWAPLRGNPWRQWMAALMAVNYSVAIARVVLRQFYIEPVSYERLMTAALGIKGSVVLSVIALAALQRLSAARDVRERLRQAERQQRDELQAAVDQRTTELHQAMVAATEANSAKTDFLARVSHDLRSPLTSINGYAQLLQRKGGRTGQLAQTIRHSAEHMQTMVNDLIDFARGSHTQQPDVRPVYVHRFLDDMAEQASALAAQHGNRFSMTLQTELPPVLLIDAKRVRQMLVNLLENAAKFTQQGLVALEVSALPQGPQRLELRLAVRDTGVGLSAADQARMFEPFFRGASAQSVQGVGLGLSIVKTWTERLGGRVHVQSSPGLGSTFTLSLPVEVGSEADMASPQQLDDVVYLPAIDGGGRQVWVVEDNPDIRALLTEELDSTGFEVMAFADGVDVVARVRQPDTPAPSAVLTDYLMPGADGAAVLRAVRGKWPGVPVVLLSATQKTMQSLGVARDEGFDASLTKPLNLADLRLTLARVLGLAVARESAETRPLGFEDTHPATPFNRPETAGGWLTAQDLTQVEQWVEMGALTDLTEWAEALPRRHPEGADFSARVLTLLANAQLDKVRALCETVVRPPVRG